MLNGIFKRIGDAVNKTQYFLCSVMIWQTLQMIIYMSIMQIKGKFKGLRALHYFDAYTHTHTQVDTHNLTNKSLKK